MKTIRDTLITQAVKNMKVFGYPYVNEKNILTDTVYKMFFISMIKENIELGHNIEIYRELNKLLKELE